MSLPASYVSAELRKLAQTNEVEFHGVLWVFDTLLVHKLMPNEALVKSLETIAGHPRCRLPRNEVQACLTRLKSSI
jgi:hypothetical protein